MNRRNKAIIEWVWANRPDLVAHIDRALNDDGMAAFLAIGFESGRCFQRANPEAAYDNPNVYDERFDLQGRPLPLEDAEPAPLPFGDVGVGQTFTVASGARTRTPFIYKKIRAGKAQAIGVKPNVHESWKMDIGKVKDFKTDAPVVPIRP